MTYPIQESPTPRRFTPSQTADFLPKTPIENDDSVIGERAARSLDLTFPFQAAPSLLAVPELRSGGCKKGCMPRRKRCRSRRLWG